MSFWYPTLEECIREIFPVIHERLSQAEMAPAYEEEYKGMNELRKILVFLRSRHYATFHIKAAYLICSVVTGHAFSNGNKRLAVTLLLAFLLYNGAKIRKLRRQTYETWVNHTFHGYEWDDAVSIGSVHMTFLYHLALALANSPTWQGKSFTRIRRDVAKFFRKLYVRY